MRFLLQSDGMDSSMRFGLAPLLALALCLGAASSEAAQAGRGKTPMAASGGGGAMASGGASLGVVGAAGVASAGADGTGLDAGTSPAPGHTAGKPRELRSGSGPDAVPAAGRLELARLMAWIGAAAAVGLLGLLGYLAYQLVLALRLGLPIGVTTHWGGFGNSAGGWQISPGLAMLLAIGVVAVSLAVVCSAVASTVVGLVAPIAASPAPKSAADEK
jgi:hypothetical protein